MFYGIIHHKKAYLSYSETPSSLILHTRHLPDLTDEETQHENTVREALARAAFDYVERRNLTVVPQSTYVANDFLPNNPGRLDQVKERTRQTLLRRYYR